MKSMKLVAWLCVSAAAVAALVSCTSSNPQLPDPKDVVCVMENGEYTGEPTEVGVMIVSVIVKEMANRANFPISDATARGVARVVLRAYCQGQLDDITDGIKDRIMTLKAVDEEKHR